MICLPRRPLLHTFYEETHRMNDRILDFMPKKIEPAIQSLAFQTQSKIIGNNLFALSTASPASTRIEASTGDPNPPREANYQFTLERVSIQSCRNKNNFWSFNIATIRSQSTSRLLLHEGHYLH